MCTFPRPEADNTIYRLMKEKMPSIRLTRCFVSALCFVLASRELRFDIVTVLFIQFQLYTGE